MINKFTFLFRDDYTTIGIFDLSIARHVVNRNAIINAFGFLEIAIIQ